MNLNDVLSLRDKLIDSYYSEGLSLNPDDGLRAQGQPVLRYPTQRLSVGARFVSQDRWKLAVRLQKENGRAMTHAKQFIEELQLGPEVDLAIVEASVPARGKLMAQSGGGGDDDPPAARCRPPEIGHSIGHLDGGPGTLGLFALRKDEPVALSCNHVLALANSAAAGDEIFQAGPPDSHPFSEDRLGKLGNFQFLRSTGSNEIDAAYCEIEEEHQPESNAIPAWAQSDAGKKLHTPIVLDELADLLAESDARVAKVGRSTMHTSTPAQNVVVGINDITVFVPGLGNCRFDNVIEIEADAGEIAFSDVGDSGSVVYVSGEFSTFGMIFCGGTTTRTGVTRSVSYACDLSAIFEAYDLEPMV